LKKASRTTGQDRAFCRLVECISAVPESARWEIFRLSLTDREHPDAMTCHILKTIRKELEAFVSIDDFTRTLFEADELDDAKNNVKVAVAVDRMLLQSLTKSSATFAESDPVLNTRAASHESE
jgi:hypothetical protein